MPFWVSNTTTLLATAHGFAWLKGKDWELFALSREGLRHGDDPPPIRSFAVLDERADRVLFGQEGRPLSIVERGGGVRPCVVRGADVLAVAGAPGGALVAAVRAGQDVVLARATLEGDTLSVGERVTLGDHRRIRSVPGFFSVRGQSAWLEEREGDDDDDPPPPPAFDVLSRGGTGTVTLASGPHGISVTSTYNGLCAVIDAKTLAPRMVVRVPAEQDQFQLFLSPLERGALVTAVANYRHTIFLFVDDEGNVVASRDTLGKEPAWGSQTSAVPLGPEKVLVSQQSTDEMPYTLALPGLTAKAFGSLQGGIIDHGSAYDGSGHIIALTAAAFASPHNWQIHRIESSGRSRPSELPGVDFRAALLARQAASTPRATTSRESGPAAIGVTADPHVPWQVRVGETTTLRLTAVNTGGPAAGLWVELSGQAITGGHAASLSPRMLLPSAVLEGAEIAAAKKGVPPPGPRPSASVEVEVRGVKPGKQLLTVRVGALGPKGPIPSGSGLCGRILEVI